MKKTTTVRLFAVTLLFTLLPAHADNLVQVYEQAVISDPTFKEAEANWQAAKENLPIAASQYLPFLDLQATGSRNYRRNTPGLRANGYFWQYSYNITLTQPIFDSSAWAAIAGAKANVKAATATYAAAVQNLIARTARAYFEVLRAYDKLRFTLANKRAVYRQLVTAEQKFKVGLIAITGVYDAQSVYDQSIANEIFDRNDLNKKLEDLRIITGKHYRILSGLGRRVPLTKPVPNNINVWVRTAEIQNYALRAQDYAVIQARQNIKQQAAARWPVVDAVVNYNPTYDRRNPGLLRNTATRNGSVGLSADFPILQGGLVGANTKQARFQFLAASEQLDFTHRTVVNGTRKSFLDVITGISQVRADLQAIKSANNAVKATEAGYVVGTRTMVDVLNDLSTLYARQQQFADDQYTYILSTIDLKENTGILSVSDLRKINTWLTKRIRFQLSPEVYGPPPRRSRKHRRRKARKVKATKNTTVTADTDVDTNGKTKKDISKTNPDLYKIPPTEPIRTDRGRQPRISPPAPDTNTTNSTTPSTTTPNTNSTTPKTDTTNSSKRKQSTRHVTNKADKKIVVGRQTTNYAIQLFAGKKQKYAKHFIKLQKTKNLNIVRKGLWYRVVYGVYGTQQQAVTAMKKLPKHLAKHKPYVIKVIKPTPKLALTKNERKDTVANVGMHLPAPAHTINLVLPAPNKTKK